MIQATRGQRYQGPSIHHSSKVDLPFILGERDAVQSSSIDNLRLETLKRPAPAPRMVNGTERET